MREKEDRLAKLSSFIKGRYGSIAFIPFIVVFAIISVHQLCTTKPNGKFEMMSPIIK